MAKLVGFAGLAKRGELVYEPFLGSGTTLAAAELTERDDLLFAFQHRRFARAGDVLWAFDGGGRVDGDFASKPSENL